MELHEYGAMPFMACVIFMQYYLKDGIPNTL
ncbi:hypothetical protein J2Z42_001399 [Clostridium algifaecis]|uniref:Uncharacterized protein n=1 Tax=Clostridium algifaecis TaxID=1472040 RepID=A0ABS4KRR6_9CLOT|nr:hypothetical protein [Clostridium algifaecis]